MDVRKITLYISEILPMAFPIMVWQNVVECIHNNPALQVNTRVKKVMPHTRREQTLSMCGYFMFELIR